MKAESVSHKPSVVKQEPAKPLSALPPHLRSKDGPIAASTPAKPIAQPAAPAKTGLQTPVHTPHNPQQHAQNQSRPNNRPAAPQVAHVVSDPNPSNGKHVSFAQAPETKAEIDYDEESYGMNSEDDALYASVNMDELDVDDGIGGPVDFDEGSGDGVVWDFPDDDPQAKEVRYGVPQQGQQRAPQQVQHSSRDVQPQDRHVDQQRPLAQLQAQRPQQAQREIAGLRGNPTDTTASGSTHQGTTSGPHRPSPPSMGGFRFPMDMNARSNGTGPTSRSAASASSSSSMVGLKRSADIMQGLAQISSSSRRGPGMGLAQQPNSSNAVSSSMRKREPLAPIDLGGTGDGNDAKRIRR